MRNILLVITVVLSGCGTIVNGSSQKVAFDTAPGGGTMKIYWSPLYRVKPLYDGPLPATVELPRGKFIKYDVEREGYLPKTAEIRPTMSGWEAVSDAVPLFATVDALSGGGRKFDNQIIIPMEPLPQK